MEESATVGVTKGVTDHGRGGRYGWGDEKRYGTRESEVATVAVTRPVSLFGYEARLVIGSWVL